MSTPSFEQLLDACIDDIAAGRRTVAECLERWPQHAGRLRPLLEAAPSADFYRPVGALGSQFMALETTAFSMAA